MTTQTQQHYDLEETAYRLAYLICREDAEPLDFGIVDRIAQYLEDNSTVWYGFGDEQEERTCAAVLIHRYYSPSLIAHRNENLLYVLKSLSDQFEGDQS